MNKEIKLSGSNYEMARQFFDLIRERKLSIEELRELMPLNKDFVQSLMAAVNKTIESEVKSDEKYYDTINQLSNNITAIIRDGNITESDREQLIQLLKQIAEQLERVKTKSDEEKSQFKRFLVKVGAAVAAVIVIVAGNK